MEIILEIIKITLPALIVFATVYFLMKNHAEKELALRRVELQNNKTDKLSSITVPLKLTAYERLSLFCERISLSNLLMRLPTDNQSAAALRVGLLLAVQQEFEHNLSQQIYISDNLWQIIKLCKDDTLTVINGLYEKVPEGADAKAFARVINSYLEQTEGVTPLMTALAAIRKEAAVVLG